MSERISVDVAFVVEEGGTVLAIMPGQAGNTGLDTCACYAHIGQHSIMAMDYTGICHPANKSHYADLLAELERIGYDVYIISASRIHDAKYLDSRKEQLGRGYDNGID